MRVLVTGSSGHIGGAIAQCLNDAGHAVTGVSRTKSPRLSPQIRQYDLDIGREAFCAVLEADHGAFDAVIHAAACLDESGSALEIGRTNCLGMHHVLEAAVHLNAACFIYVSGLNVVGPPREHPITEASPIAPEGAYAASKVYGECLALSKAAESMRTVVFRPSSPVGPGLRRKRIFRLFVQKALDKDDIPLNGSGTRRQDYVDVRDVADAVQKALTSDCRGVFNIAAGIPVSNLELAQNCIHVLGSTSEIRMTGLSDPDDDLCWDVSIEKARRSFAYVPQHTLEQSIRDFAAELKENAAKKGL